MPVRSRLFLAPAQVRESDNADKQRLVLEQEVYQKRPTLQRSQEIAEGFWMAGFGSLGMSGRIERKDRRLAQKEPKAPKVNILGKISDVHSEIHKFF